MKIKAKARRIESYSTVSTAQSTSSPIPSTATIKPNNRGLDDLALIFFFFAVVGTYFFELLIVCRKIHHSDEGSIWLIIHGLIGSYILHNILGNFIMIIKHESTIRGKLLTLSSGSNTANNQAANQQRYCLSCETYSPPRSHHCLVCDVCVLKRDHHCTFAKTCIGYSNYRYFIPLLVHIALGSFYCSVLNMLFIWDLLGGFNIYNFLSHIFPFLFWLFGRLTLYPTVCCLISVINIAAFLFTIGLLIYHGSMMITNQTVYEKNKAIRIYDLGNWKLNVEQALGDRYFLILLSPFIQSKIPGNGKAFPTRQEYFLNSSKTK